MSGPGFPSGPLYPYGSANQQQFPSMPQADGSFSPPQGPPPNFPSHEPGFPSHEPSFPSNGPSFPSHGPSFPSHEPGFPSPPHEQERGFHTPGFPSEHHAGAPPPPPGHSGPPPPSGFRVPLSTGQPFPPPQQTGQPVAHDLDRSPVFVGSALLGNSVHPCKIVPALHPPCRVPYGGTEHEHNGRYDLLPFDANLMEWVPTSHGRIPPSRRPVEGGYEEHGGKLYHALAQINGLNVPGKTGEHLGGCNVAFAGGEHSIKENYQILCWR